MINKTNIVDLHIHTTCSDGTKTPEEVLKEAEQLGLKRIAITDHETVEAYFGENGIIEGVKKGIYTGIIIPGAEFKALCPVSVSDGEKQIEIELLGYSFSIEDMQNGISRLYMNDREESNKSYLKKIVTKLRKNGIVLPKDIERNYTDFTTQPSKYVLSVLTTDESNLKGNIEILCNNDTINHDLKKESLYRGWLSNPDSSFYVHQEYPDFTRVATLIRECGGKVFIPHLYKFSYPEIVLSALLSSGKIDGIECYYPTFKPEQTDTLLHKCTQWNLFPSGGSDYHGANKRNELGRGLNNNLYIPEEKVIAWTNGMSLEKVLARRQATPNILKSYHKIIY